MILGNPQTKTAKAAVPPSCGGCLCFVPPADKPGADPVMLSASGGDKGECLRFPQTVRKLPSQVCYEHIPKEPKPDAR